ncbi:MAG: DUF4238 domain-containing protein [Boseongicola sp.]|nr:DUF4238 domain-containing protein [Boseongicola sp.]
MGANRSRRHHYVPQMLLGNFLDDEGALWVGDQKRGKCYRSNPGNVFVEKNLYTRHDWGRGTECYDHERALARVESDAKPALSSLILQVREGRNPQLCPDLNRKFKQFLVALARRTPESQARIFGEPDRPFNEAFDRVAKDRFREAGREVPDQDWFDRDPAVLRVKRNAKANLSAGFAAGEHENLQQETEKFVRETGWGVARICLPEWSFVIGSHGLTIMAEGSRMGGSWLPIAHDVAIWVTAFPSRGCKRCLDHSNERMIKAINSATAAQSDMIAGRSEDLVRCLTMQRNRPA